MPVPFPYWLWAATDLVVTARDVLKTLLREIAEGRPWSGWTLANVSPRGDSADLEFGKDGERLVVFLTPAEAETDCFRKTRRFRIGYRGDPSLPGALALVEEVAARISAREASLPKDLRELWRPAPRPDGRLVVSDHTLELRVTLRCNERCPFCNTDDLARNVMRNDIEVVTAIESAPGLGVSQVVFTGGEPTLARRLPEWVRIAKSLGLVVSIQSNGVLPGLPSFWRRFESEGCLPDHLYLSFHTARPERLETLTGVAGTLPRKVRTVHEARRRGIAVGLNFVANTRNLDELPEFPSFVLREFGRDIPVDLSLAAPTGRCQERMDLIPRMRDAAPWFARALDEAARLGLRFEIMRVCGFPPCILPERAEAFQILRKAQPCTSLPPERVKGPSCARCRWDPICLGVWRRYAEVHGLDEFEPVR